MKSLFKVNGKELNLRLGLQNSSGSILIVCFFVLVLLTLFTITVGYTMRQKFQVLSRLDARQKLRLVGDAGVQKAIYDFLKYREQGSSYDALNQSWSRSRTELKDVEVGDGFFSVFYPDEHPQGELSAEDGRRYGLIDEERKIDLNRVKSPEILRRLFREAGAMREADAAALVDAIRDWTDEDDDTSLTGAESYY
ncbi:MAG: type II secretion system protein GspK, partial [Candidatus Omnitrophica bacterium]|nr:type II secretion system protein GspK [Candidatus Omnitrophota bacterium]